ncbi:hypothetical protein [Streptomyces salinarius]|uniref:hypothetical protein n=1 Tax=Streptomyces salinarius TaxID=2762598 RepID=UPI0016447B99|nr:hypothetical protein [Streptomyces salinarius]
MRRHGVIAALAAVAAVVGPALVGCTTADDSSTSAPSGESRAEEQQAGKEGNAEPQGGRTESGQGERDDLRAFEIDDRSQAGFQDIWVTWTIKNQSSEKSNYSWQWEAVDPDGKRLYNSTEYVTDVQPGQTATGESPTALRTPDVKINITGFERTKAY